jgi:hypothetical protein
MAPSDFALFLRMKKFTRGRRFEDRGQVQEEIVNILNRLIPAEDKGFYRQCMVELVERYEKCVQLRGDYVEKTYFVDDDLTSDDD